MSTKAVLEEFANHTTMHGVPKVIHARSVVSRVLWALICVVAGGLFCIQTTEVLTAYFSYPKKVTVEVVPTPVPFPHISMCNMRHLDFFILNILNRKFLDDHRPLSHINSTHPFIRQYMKVVAKYGALFYKYQNDYPVEFQEIFSRTTFSANIPEDIMSMAGIQLEELIVSCHFGWHGCNISRDFSQFFDPYYYNCYTYKAQGVVDSNGHMAHPASSEGIENGWSAILFSGSGVLDKNKEVRVLPGLHETRSAVSDSEGVRVVIHPPDTQPFPFTEGYDVPPGFSASFGIHPRRMIRIGNPYGNCSHSNPFGGKWSQYRSMECQKMCLQSYVIEYCNCSDSLLPSLNGVSSKSCRSSEDFPDSCTHNATKECLEKLLEVYARIQCARRIRVQAARNNTLVEQCKCHPPCEEVYYDVTYSLSKWPAAGYEGDAVYLDVFHIEDFTYRFRHNNIEGENVTRLEQLEHYFNESTREKSMEDFARLNVYIADSNVVKTEESPEITPTQLVSDIGGQMGLWVGISIITLTEVLELIGDVIRMICLSKMRRKQAPGNGTAQPRLTRVGAIRHSNLTLNRPAEQANSSLMSQMQPHAKAMSNMLRQSTRTAAYNPVKKRAQWL